MSDVAETVEEKNESYVNMHFYNLNTKTQSSKSLNYLEVINE